MSSASLKMEKKNKSKPKAWPAFVSVLFKCELKNLRLARALGIGIRMGTL